MAPGNHLINVRVIALKNSFYAAIGHIPRQPARLKLFAVLCVFARKKYSLYSAAYINMNTFQEYRSLSSAHFVVCVVGFLNV